MGTKEKKHKKDKKHKKERKEKSRKRDRSSSESGSDSEEERKRLKAEKQVQMGSCQGMQKVPTGRMHEALQLSTHPNADSKLHSFARQR